MENDGEGEGGRGRGCTNELIALGQWGRSMWGGNQMVKTFKRKGIEGGGAKT